MAKNLHHKFMPTTSKKTAKCEVLKRGWGQIPGSIGGDRGGERFGWTRSVREASIRRGQGGGRREVGDGGHEQEEGSRGEKRRTARFPFRPHILNPSFARVTGTTGPTVAGSTARAVVPPDARAVVPLSCTGSTARRLQFFLESF